MVLLTPLGLLAPGGAFGESAPSNLDLHEYHLDAVPHGLQHYAGFWHNTLFNGYDFAGDKHPNVGYIVSALFGVVVVALVLLVVATVVRFIQPRQRLTDHETDGEPTRDEATRDDAVSVGA
jgi:cobalt/nickel transport system permease protein